MKQRLPIYLASASPRRKDILSQMGINFHVMPSDAPEDCTLSEPSGVVMELAQRKAAWIVPCISEEEAVVIGSDTVVSVDGVILGKPVDAEDAKRMLRSLSGRTHEVYTGVSLAIKSTKGTEYRTFYTCSQVCVMELSEAEIDAYVATGTCMDKAGAYGIQGEFGKFIEAFHGDYFTIVGLPMNELYKKLRENNIILV